MSVLTAPDNGTGQFTQAAVVTTAANGTWTATQEVLVSDRDAADGRLRLRAGRFRTSIRSGRRASAASGTASSAP